MTDSKSQGQEAQSPLAEVQPQTLGELFSRDPLSLSDQDIDKIVEELRRQRAKWQEAEATGRKSAAKAAAPSHISLADIGL